LSVVAYLWGRYSGSMAQRESPGLIVSRALPKVVAVAPAAVAQREQSFDRRWLGWKAQVRTPATERDAESALLDLARRDPARAMELALGENNPALRERWRNAVLKGWAAHAPDEAAGWARALPPADRRQALVAVFAGAVENPEAAIRLGERLCRQIPTDAADCGQLLIAALTEAGAYESAACFALGGSAENGPAWLNAAYYQWAMRQPELALKAFGAISDPAARSVAFQGLASGWAEANPAAVASYAVQLPVGADRAAALSVTLSQWAMRDPLTASEWMLKNLNPSLDLDEGVAAVASLPGLVSRRPEIAIGWAENIADPSLRVTTLTAVVQLWAQREPEAARRFVLSAGAMPQLEREALALGLAPGP
jgi:hypothetical protein